MASTPSVPSRTPIMDPSSSLAPPVSKGRAPTLIGGEEVVYRGRLNTIMMQVKTSSTATTEADHDSGFFFSANDLDADGLDYLSEQAELLFGNETIEDDAKMLGHAVAYEFQKPSHEFRSCSRQSFGSQH